MFILLELNPNSTNCLRSSEISENYTSFRATYLSFHIERIFVSSPNNRNQWFDELYKLIYLRLKTYDLTSLTIL